MASWQKGNHKPVTAGKRSGFWFYDKKLNRSVRFDEAVFTTRMDFEFRRNGVVVAKCEVSDRNGQKAYHVAEAAGKSRDNHLALLGLLYGGKDL